MSRCRKCEGKRKVRSFVSTLDNEVPPSPSLRPVIMGEKGGQQTHFSSRSLLPSHYYIWENACISQQTRRKQHALQCNFTVYCTSRTLSLLCVISSSHSEEWPALIDGENLYGGFFFLVCVAQRRSNVCDNNRRFHLSLPLRERKKKGAGDCLTAHTDSPRHQGGEGWTKGGRKMHFLTSLPDALKDLI